MSTRSLVFLLAAAISWSLAGCTDQKPVAAAKDPPSGSPGVKKPSEPAHPEALEPPDQKKEKGEEKGEEKTAADYLQQVQSLAQKENWKGALQSIKKAIELEPKNRQYRFLRIPIEQQLALQTSQAGDKDKAYQMFIELAEYARQYRKDFPDSLNTQEESIIAVCYYNQARGYAIQGDKKKALSSLKESIVAGFTDFEHIRKDEDFASLRDSENFKTLLKEQQERLKKEAIAQIRQQLKDNKPFPFDFKLPDLEDKPVSLDDFKGKVVIVDFWGTWCPPCLEEVPHFIALKKKYGEKGLAIVGINYEGVDAADAKAKIKEFAEKEGINYPCVIGDEATQEQVPDLTGYPTTLFIDRAGKVRLKLVGYRPMEQLEVIVQELLAEPGK